MNLRSVISSIAIILCIAACSKDDEPFLKGLPCVDSNVRTVRVGETVALLNCSHLVYAEPQEPYAFMRISFPDVYFPNMSIGNPVFGVDEGEIVYHQFDSAGLYVITIEANLTEKENQNVSLNRDTIQIRVIP